MNALDKLPIGSRVLVGHKRRPATFHGPNERLPGNYWVEFHDGNWSSGMWSYSPSDITPAPRLPM